MNAKLWIVTGVVGAIGIAVSTQSADFENTALADVGELVNVVDEETGGVGEVDAVVDEEICVEDGDDLALAQAEFDEDSDGRLLICCLDSKDSCTLYAGRVCPSGSSETDCPCISMPSSSDEDDAV